MYNEPIRITFVSWPSGPMATVFHHEHDQNFINWLEVEIDENGAVSQPHYDYYSMWEDHIDKEAYEAFLDERDSYRTDQEMTEDSFLFIEVIEDDTILDAQFEDSIPF